MKIFISLSAMPLSLARRYVKGFDRTRYAALFNKYGSGKGRDKYRIYLPVDTQKPLVDKTPVPEEILTFLSEKKMMVDNYLAGTALLPDGKRTVRIGKLLANEPGLKKIYDNDPSRKGITAKELMVVISRHPYDIAGMSFDRGWTSCTNLDGGENMRFVKPTIKAGALVAYLVKNDDKNINAPIARVLLKPHKSAGNIILVPSKEHGDAPKSFQQVVDKFCKLYNSSSPQGDYKMVRGVYNDAEPESSYHYTGDENIPARHKQAAAGSKDIPYTLLERLASDTKTEVRAKAAMNSTSKAPLLVKLSKDPEASVRMKVAENPNTPVPTLVKLAKDTEAEVRGRVGVNPNTPVPTLVKLAKDTDTTVRAIVGSHPNTPAPTLVKLAKDLEEQVQGQVCLNPNTPVEVLARMADDPSGWVASNLARNPSTPVEALDRLARNIKTGSDGEVAENPNASAETLAFLAVEGDGTARVNVAKHLNTPTETLVMLLKDFKEVRVQARINLARRKRNNRK